jgi:hypothetical protein
MLLGKSNIHRTSSRTEPTIENGRAASTFPRHLSPPLTTTARDSRPNPSLEFDPAAFGRLRAILLYSSRRLLRSSCLPSSHRERCLVGLGVVFVSPGIQFFSYAVSLLKPLVLLLLQRGAHDASPSAGTTTADANAVGSFGSSCLAFFLAVCF